MRLALAALLVLTLAACGSPASTVDKARLSQLVLQPSDLPTVFSRFDEGALGRDLRVEGADQPVLEDHGPVSLRVSVC